MSNNSNTKPVYDLEERTYEFAKRVRILVKKLPNTISNTEDIKQVIRSSGSVGTNYIEANEALSKKDFLMRIKISRKEAKECIFWLKLLNETNDQINNVENDSLINEAIELKKILSSIIEKSK